MKNDDFENFKKTEDRLEGQTYFYRLKMTEKCRKIDKKRKKNNSEKTKLKEFLILLKIFPKICVQFCQIFDKSCPIFDKFCPNSSTKLDFPPVNFDVQLVRAPVRRTLFFLDVFFGHL